MLFPITAKFNEKSGVVYKQVIGIEQAKEPKNPDLIERGYLGLFSLFGKQNKIAGQSKNTPTITNNSPMETTLVLAETSDGYNRRVTIPGAIESIREKIEAASQRKEPYVDLTGAGGYGVPHPQR